MEPNQGEPLLKVSIHRLAARREDQSKKRNRTHSGISRLAGKGTSFPSKEQGDSG